MPWANKDCGAWSDSTLAALSDRAYRLHDCCWTFCADKLTDGHLTRDEVARVAFVFGLKDPDCLRQAISELVTWGLWIEDLNGYEITIWLQQNRSREEVDASRESNRERQARWRQEQRAKAAKSAGKRGRK